MSPSEPLCCSLYPLSDLYRESFERCKSTVDQRQCTLLLSSIKFVINDSAHSKVRLRLGFTATWRRQRQRWARNLARGICGVTQVEPRPSSEPGPGPGSLKGQMAYRTRDRQGVRPFKMVRAMPVRIPPKLCRCWC